MCSTLGEMFLVSFLQLWPFLKQVLILMPYCEMKSSEINMYFKNWLQMHNLICNHLYQICFKLVWFANSTANILALLAVVWNCMFQCTKTSISVNGLVNAMPAQIQHIYWNSTNFFRKLLFKCFTEFNASCFVFIHDDNLSFWKKKICLTIDLRQLEAKYLSVYQKLLCFSKVPGWTLGEYTGFEGVTSCLHFNEQLSGE